MALQCPVLVHGYKGTFASFFKDCLLNVDTEPLQGWKFEIIACMIQNKLLDGSFEYDSFSPDYSYGYPTDFDSDKASMLLQDMIRAYINK